MESMREINRVMEREIKKGSTPLKLEQVEIGKDSYHEIKSEEKLLEVLSYLLRTGEYESYAGKTVRNNVYMDRKGRNTIFRRGKLAYERNCIFKTIRRLATKYEPNYGGGTYLETVRCCFSVPLEELKKYQYIYEGKETYAFLLSDKMILSLYTLCMAERRELALAGHEELYLSAVDRGMAKLENIREVLFQTLLLDTVRWEEGKLYADFCTIYLLEG